MSLVTADDVIPLVPSPLSRPALQAVIDRIEGELTSVLGQPYEADLELVETHRVTNRTSNLYLKRKVQSVVSVVERRKVLDPDETLDEDVDYYVVHNEGILERILSNWGERVVVTYTPVDDRDKWKSAIIDLCRIYLSRTALKSEGVTGSHQYSAPENWDAEVRRVVKRLQFAVV